MAAATQMNPIESDMPVETKVPITHLRNVAIIAHVDHGKTTLVDRMLRQGGATLSGERVMDSNTLEQERGITILAKCTSIKYRDYQINIVDTPGHADFGGEVERIMSMVDGVVLLVDATEGPMTQTKFVLGKALKRNLHPVVVLNKVDRPSSRLGEVENEIFDLFVNLDATDQQLEFPILYASARDGWVARDPGAPRQDMQPLLDTILEHVPPPMAAPSEPFSMLVTMIEQDQYLGRIVTGRIYSGEIRLNAKLKAINTSGEAVDEGKCLKIMARHGGLDRMYLDVGQAGDIISIAGMTKATVTDTVCDALIEKPIPAVAIDPPTIAVTFTVNDGPLSGQEGKQVTTSIMRERLLREKETNVAITVEESADKESFEVKGRGELQLGILLENMRREGFELCISPPRVVYKIDEDGNKLEPVEEVIIEVNDADAGSVVEKLTSRKGECLEMKPSGMGRTRLVFLAPSRGLIGFQSQFISDTRGEGILNRIFHSYQPYKGGMEKIRRGVLVSMDEGVTTSYALSLIEPRGTLFVGPQTKVYAGMIVGENSRDSDLDINPVREKRLTNIRTTSSEEAIRLTPPRIMTLEDAIGYIKDDEMVEVTPKSIRLRKKILDQNKRRAAVKREKNTA